MIYQFDFRPYRRSFKRRLSTSHGIWKVREGIILRLIDHTGRVGWGEIAPIPWFGCETLEQALHFCQQLPQKITTEIIFSIPDALPACQFGFESAADTRQGQSIESSPSPIACSCLLPTGEAALQAWQTLWHQGHRTFKWKIGVAPIEDELKLFRQLMQALPPDTQLRLDANGGLSQQEAQQWLNVADEAGRVEFLEQPLPPTQLDAMLELSHLYRTPIALDESVATLNQLQACYDKGWRGIFVIKAAIAGSPQRLRQFCQTYTIDTVFSSVLETAIAKHAVFQLVTELSNSNRAVGFGIDHWFNEDDASLLKRLWNSY